ncbi:MAG: hypothetical protein KF752_08285 [Pirellulaceae bacterium]|nr:hypothetical protein [Pirellulaceae bacterium]
MPVTITDGLRVCVNVLRDLFEATDRFEHFRLIAPNSIDILTVHLVKLRKMASVCFDPFNRMNVIADLPSVEMDGRTSLSVHEATYEMLEKAHSRLTIRFAGLCQLDSAERQRLIGKAIQQVLESLKTLPQFAWSELDAELRKEEIRVQEFISKSFERGSGSNNREKSVAHPLQILSAGNAAIADAQKAVSDTLAIANQALSNGEHSKGDCRVESKFPRPNDSLTDDAIEYLKKSFHKLPHAGTAKVNHVIAAAVRDGIQRNTVEWALVRMQEYGWIKLSIPVWGGVIGNRQSEPMYRPPVQERKPTRWYFGTHEYNLRLTEYFYNPSYCRTCSKLIGDYDRDECHECRSPKGKLAELEVAIKCQHLYGNENDSPERIREWLTIRAYLRDRFGSDRTNMQLWEWMTDHLRVLGWDQERWLRMKYGEFIELLKSGLLNERSPEIKGGSAVQSSAKVPLYDDDVHIGMVDLSGLTKLCTSLLRQDKRQGTLYRDEAGRFIYHVWDYDDRTIGRTCRLMRPVDACEVALKADQFFVASDELIAELAGLKRRGERTTESDGCFAIESPTAETAKEPIEALDALSDKKRIDALIKSFKEETEGFSDNQWSDKVDRRTKAKAKEGRGRKTRSFYFEGVGGIYYGDERTYVIRGDDRRGYYSLAATHSERIGKKFAMEFSLNRR